MDKVSIVEMLNRMRQDIGRNCMKLDRNKIWSGMEYKYYPLDPVQYIPIIENFNLMCKNIVSFIEKNGYTLNESGEVIKK